MLFETTNTNQAHIYTFLVRPSSSYRGIELPFQIKPLQKKSCFAAFCFANNDIEIAVFPNFGATYVKLVYIECMDFENSHLFVRDEPTSLSPQEYQYCSGHFDWSLPVQLDPKK